MGTLRRIDFVCGSPRLLRNEFDTWVERELDVATFEDDHYPTVVELCWQPVAPYLPVQWHCPVVDRRALV